RGGGAPANACPRAAPAAAAAAGGRAPAATDDVLDDGLGAGDVDVADRHHRPLVGEQARRRAPDAERATGDRCHPPLQLHRAVSILACPEPEEARMKAIVFGETGGPDVLALAEVPKPDVRPGMVLIRVHAIRVHLPDTP